MTEKLLNKNLSLPSAPGQVKRERGRPKDTKDKPHTPSAEGGKTKKHHGKKKNKFLTNGFSHYYHLGESTFILRCIRSDSKVSYNFLIKILLANRIARDTAFCDIISGAILYAYVP